VRLVYDEIYGDHLRGIPHAESPDRVEMVAAFLQESGRFDDVVKPRSATDEEIERAHTPEYLARVKSEIDALRGVAAYLSTGDTVVDRRSLHVAKRAAGGAIAAVEATASDNRPSFALIRPPGHHAESRRGMGFCVFNNAAIAARAFQAAQGGRVLIVDFDYHHGNGTQELSGRGISYVSTHAYPAYPGTGSADENERTGEDLIANVPLPTHDFGTEAFLAVWKQLLPLAAAAVRPSLIVASAGFDYVAKDPVGDLGVAWSAATPLALLVADTAAEYCDGRAVFLLEGGYNIAALQESVARVIDAFDRPSEVTTSNAEPAAIPQAQARILERVAAAADG